MNCAIDHEYFMRHCLDLARIAMGCTCTNPMVGCIIVYKGNIIASGFHQQFGEAHAEVEAFNQVQDKGILKECSIYVYL